MADMKDLANFMDSLLQHNPAAELANILAVRAAKAIVEDLALHTPADVGTALSNWRVSLDVPSLDTIPAYVPSPKGSARGGLWAHKVPPVTTILNNAPSVIDAAKAVLATKKPGQRIFIVNNVEYITLLDGGSSQQSPANFVRRAEIIGQAAIDKTLATINISNVQSVTP